MSSTASQDLSAAVEEYYESNDEEMGSLTGTIEENKKTLNQLHRLKSSRKQHKKNSSSVKSKKRKNADEEDGSVAGSSPSAKSEDDGEGSLGESLRCSSKSKLFLIDVCKICYRKHMHI